MKSRVECRKSTSTRALSHKSGPELQLPPVQRVREVEQFVQCVRVARLEQLAAAARAARRLRMRMRMRLLRARAEQLVFGRVRLESDALEPLGHLLGAYTVA